jgi:hypothetical protein
MRWCLACVLGMWLAVTAGFVTPVGAQTPETSELYDRVLSEAISAFKARQWTRARDLFQRAHEMSPSARTLRGIGVTAFEGGEYVAAVHALEAALVHPEKQLPPDLREGTLALIAEARERVGSVALTLTPESAQVRCDGQEVAREPDGSLLLDPGPHTLVFSAAGFEPREERLSVTSKERGTLTVALPPEREQEPSPLVVIAAEPKISRVALSSELSALGPIESHRPATPDAPPPLVTKRGRRFLAYGTLALTLASVATSAALFARSTELNEELHSWCTGPDGTCPEHVEAAEDRKHKIDRFQRAFGTTVGLSVSAGVAALTLFTLERMERRRQRRARDHGP